MPDDPAPPTDPGSQHAAETPPVSGSSSRRPRRRLPALFRLKKDDGTVRKRPRVFAVFPTLLTLGNAACGFGAITFATKTGLAIRFGFGKTDEQCLFIAGLLIFLAMVCDALDGRVARWAKQSSEFGAQLDSLCDAISFGAAPAIILVKFTEYAEKNKFTELTDGIMGRGLHPRVLWAIAIVYVSCALLRLARFNVETDEDDSHNEFSGLPSPAAAGTIASLMTAFPEIKEMAEIDLETASWWGRQMQAIAAPTYDSLRFVLPLVTFASACLMVSRFRYPHIFNQWFSGKRSARHILQLLLVLSAALMVRELALPLIFWSFAFIPPLMSLFTYLKKGQPPAAPATTGSPPESESRNTV